MLIVLTTTSSSVEAETLAGKLIESRLAACVQIVPGMTSVYVWKGKTMKESECLMLIKTLPEKYPEVEAFIEQNHSYDVPEIVAIDAERASVSCLQWMTDLLIDE
jgi:periplasmic divalent cation tolerance protein